MKKSILFILFFLLISYSVFGQISVKGKIFDQRRRLILRPVMIKNPDSTQVIITNNGIFEIEVKSKNDTLVFSSDGFDSQKVIANKIINDSTIILKSRSVCTGSMVSYKVPLTVRYWSGLFYNPYGIIINEGFYINKKQKNRKYFLFEVGYSTNFKRNYDFYGGLGTDIMGKYMYYIFQQTTFNKSETKNRIVTHFIGSSSNLKFIKTYLSYGIGHQIFIKKELENDKFKNFGISLGLSKKIKYIGTISTKSFYWQDYWGWETKIFRSLTRKISTSISYYQVTQNYKEANFILGYSF